MNDLTTDFADRLLTLPDGRAGLRGTLQVDAREPAVPVEGQYVPDADNSKNSCNSCLDFISSDETLDRYGEIILASGWRLENYRRNPVFQNAHQYGDVIFTLGRALITEVRGGKLYQQIEFATGVNPMARIAYGLYKGKFLNAVSVGFIPLRWQEPQSKDAFHGVPIENCASAQPDDPGTLDSSRNTENATRSTQHATPRRIYLEQELLEVSAVGIPANPNALALGLKAGAVEKNDLRELNELIRQTLGKSKEGDWEEVPIKVKRPNHFADLLRLAKEIRDLLRC